MTEISIREDFRTLIPPLSESELDQLHKSLDGHGCRDPLVVWRKKGVLLDGHNRYAYCQEHGIPFQTVEVSCSDENVAKNWIIHNQLGRRNLHPDQASLLRGKLYNARKKEKPNPEGKNQHSEVKYQSDNQPTTAEQVAKETGVSAPTVMRDAQFAAAAEKLGVEQKVMDGSEKRSRKEIVSAAKGEPAKPKKPKRQPWEKVVESFKKLKPEQMKRAIEAIQNHWDSL